MSRRLLVAIAVPVIVVGAVALALFEPWRLFTSSYLDEADPGVTVVGGHPGASATSEGTTTGSGAASSDVTRTGPGGGRADPPAAGRTVPAPGTTTLATGRFVDAEHATSGQVRITRLADGRRYVRIEDLASSDGPDLHVWLSDAPSGGKWGSYDDGRHVRLGKLKATHGNHNYRIPDDARISAMRSVVIWCDRFNVAFGTAAVRLG
ncbi:MAG: DM13 domain-containing protein [Solirubrobacteraceae bacterium]|nr:DM13 domain-containing protein [Solirubrobacteraceae bacterium]